MESLLDSAPCGFFVLSADGRVQYANATLHQMLRYPPGALAGMAIEQLLTPGSRFYFQSYILPHLRLDGAVEEIYIRLRDSGGGEVPVLLNGVRQGDTADTISHCVVVIMRQRQEFEQALIQARRAAERAHEAERSARDEAERANQAKSSFLTTITHELRTPLNAIIGFTGTLLMRLPGPLTADQEKQLSIIQRSAHHLLAMIGDILDLAKAESGRIDLYITTVSCQSIIDDVLASLLPLANKKQIALFQQPSLPLTPIHSDERVLRQIIINLVNNAIKFTDQGSVQVQAQQQIVDGQIRTAIRVIDSGIGIKPEDQQRLFQEFGRVNSPEVRSREGTGLGLRISQKLAELLGGHIALDSVYGAGSTFTLELHEPYSGAPLLPASQKIPIS